MRDNNVIKGMEILGKGFNVSRLVFSVDINIDADKIVINTAQLSQSHLRNHSSGQFGYGQELARQAIKYVQPALRQMGRMQN